MMMEYSLITPYGVMTAAAALCAFALLLAQRRRMAGKESAGVIGLCDPLELALCCIPAAFVGARFLYCLVRADFYLMEMGPAAILRTWEGGFLLYGAVFGALGAAALLAKARRVSVAATLDELAAPGLLAVVICRLAERFTTEGVGPWIENEALWRFPVAVENEWGEWQLAVFLMEAAVAAVLLIVILRTHLAPGGRILRALLLYAACQVLLESLRMDSCLRIGFVRVSQVISGVLILIITGLRAYRVGGMKRAWPRMLLVGVCAGAVGGIEWALDKTPVSNILLYLVMALVCAVMIVNGLKAAPAEK